MKNNQYIGFIDSGFGGSSVLKEAIKLMPNEKFIFFADSAHAPYGTRDKDDILNLTKTMINVLLEYNLKALVIACNTISVNCGKDLSKIYPNLKIFETKPALYSILSKDLVVKETEYRLSFNNKPKLDIKSNKKSVLIIATEATIDSPFLKKEIKNYEVFFDITKKATGEFVHFVEQMKIDTKECEEYAKTIIDKDYDYIVLGCTHFPFVKNVLEKVSHNKPIFIDNGKITAKNCYEYLKENNLLNNDSFELKIIDTNINEERKGMYKTMLGVDSISFV